MLTPVVYAIANPSTTGNQLEIDLCRSVVRCPCLTYHFGGRVLESDPSCKGSWIRGGVSGIHSIVHMFSDLTPLHFSTIRSSLVTGLLHLNTYPTHPRGLKRAEKSTSRHIHEHDNESYLTFFPSLSLSLNIWPSVQVLSVGSDAASRVWETACLWGGVGLAAQKWYASGECFELIFFPGQFGCPA